MLNSDVQQRIVSLRNAVDDRDHKIKELKRALAPVITFPAEWHLSRTESVVLSVLYAAKGECCTVERITQAVYRGAPPETDVVRQFIRLLRAKLRATGIVIDNFRLLGYSLSKRSLKIISDALVREADTDTNRRIQDGDIEALISIARRCCKTTPQISAELLSCASQLLKSVR